MGGVFCDLGVHIMDYLMWITNNPKIKSVSGSAITKIANSGEEVVSSSAESGAPLGLFPLENMIPKNLA